MKRIICVIFLLISTALFAQQTASITCICRSLVFFSDFEDEINFTTYDGSSGQPLREPIPHGFRWSAEFRPRANQLGVYEADFFATDDELTISVSGSATINLPKTDQDADGLPDIVQPNQPGDTTFTGTGQLDWPQKASFPITGKLIRETNSDRGTWLMVFSFPSGPETFEGDFRIPVVSGTVSYVRGAQNLAFVRVTYIDEDEESQIYSGSTSYKVISASQSRGSEVLITGPNQETYPVPASTWTRSGNQYRATVSILDGWPATSWPDYRQWVCVVTDDNDADKDSVPDITDSGVTTGVQPGRLDLGFNPILSDESRVRALAVQPDGNILVGGSFSSVNGLPRNGIARLNPDGTIDTEFAPLLPPTINDSVETMRVWAMLLKSDGKILLGGEDLSEEGVWRGRIIQLERDGQLDRTFNSGEVSWFDGSGSSYFSVVNCLAVQNSGNILIGGLAINDWLFPDLPRQHQGLARIHANGSLDTDFDVALPNNSEVHSIAIQYDGQVLIGGYFSEVNSQACGNLARLFADGQLDTSFAPQLDAEGRVFSIVIQNDGRILLGGSFNNLDASAAHGIARLNANGSRDANFDSENGVTSDFGLASAYILAAQPDGKVLIGGEFTKVDDAYHIGLARLNSDGSLDKTFVAEAGSTRPGIFPIVHSFAFPGDGTVLVGGAFDRMNGEPRSGLARLLLGNAPYIITQPISQTAGQGSNVTFQVVALGKGTLKYQWRFNGTNITGATSESLILKNLQATNAGNYAVLVTDANGSSPSRTATLVVIVPEGGKLWHFATGAEITSSPAIDPFGTIYFGCSNRFYAINALGQKKWEFAVGGKITSSPAISPEGTIYFGSMDSNIYAVNLDGTQKWAFPTGGAVSNAPAIGSDGTVYAGSQDSKLYAIKSDGVLKWQVATGNRIYSSPALGVDGTVYVGSSDQRLYAVNPDGTIKWTFNTGGILRSSPAIGNDGIVYIGCDDKKLYAIQPNGMMKWAFTAGGMIRSSPSIGPEATVYVGADDKKLYAIYPDGRKRWEYMTTGPVQSSPLIGADGTIYMGASNRFMAVKPEGTLKWSYAAGGRINSSPVIGVDASILFGSADGKLYAIKNSQSLASCPWPMFRKDAQHTANMQILVSSEIAGSLDPSFQAVALADGSIDILALQTDGKILAGGGFSEISGVNQKSLARLHVNGNVDESFAPQIESSPGSKGWVHCIAVQPDGKILVGGEFEWVNGEERRMLVRLLSDGRLDPSFQAFASWMDSVSAIALQRDGRILVGSGFSVLRLSTTGLIDPEFAISTEPVHAFIIVEQPDGRILVNGDGLYRYFSDGVWDASFVPGLGIKSVDIDDLWFGAFILHPDGRIYVRDDMGIMRLFPNGSVDLGFSNQIFTNAPNTHAILLQSDNTLLLATSDGVRRLQSDGNLDLDFTIPNASNYLDVRCMAEQRDRRILIGGSFGIIRVFSGPNPLSPPSITEQPGSRLTTVGTSVFLTVSASGYPPPTYQWQLEGTVIPGATNAFLSFQDVHTNQAGHYSATVMNGLGSITSETATLTVAPARPGSLDMAFNTEIGQSDPMLGSSAESILLQKDGRVLVAGWFNGLMNQELKVIRLQADGRVDPSFHMDSSSGDSIALLALQEDGKIVIGEKYSDWEDDMIARLNPDGSLDTSFGWGTVAAHGSIRALAIQRDGKILVGNGYEDWWQTSSAMARLNTNGQVDASFHASPDGSVNAIVAQSDGKIVIGGDFSAVNGTLRSGLARLNSDGGLDAVFNPKLDISPLYALALQSDGRVLACGASTNQDGYVGLRIVRVNRDGSFDLSFSSNAFIELGFDPWGNQIPASMGVQNDGKILVSGMLDQVNGVPRLGLARLKSNGSLDSGFCALIENVWDDLSKVSGLVLQQDEKIIVVGNFARVDGVARNTLARLHGGDAQPGQPVLLNTPKVHTINANEYLRLAAYASSHVTPTYQWQQDGINLPGATNPVLFPSEVQISGVDSYALVLGNAAGMVTGLVATVNIQNPYITQWPQSVTVSVGQSATFQIVAGGSIPIHYQWWFQATNPVGMGSSLLLLTNVQMNQAGEYDVVVSNPAGSITNSHIRLTVIPGLAEALNAPQWVWITSPSRPWFGQVDTSQDGQASARSAYISANQETWLETKIVGPGTISFYWKVSCQTNSDVLKFYIANNELAKVSGELGWKLESFSVPAGTNVLRWTYAKDASSSEGLDAGWLDEVTFMEQPPVIAPPTLMQPQISNGQFSVSIETIGGRPYILEYTESLPSDHWYALLEITGTGSIMRLVDPSPIRLQRYYRVRLW